MKPLLTKRTLALLALPTSFALALSVCKVETTDDGTGGGAVGGGTQTSTTGGGGTGTGGGGNGGSDACADCVDAQCSEEINACANDGACVGTDGTVDDCTCCLALLVDESCSSDDLGSDSYPIAANLQACMCTDCESECAENCGGEPPTEFTWTLDGSGDYIDSMSAVAAAYQSGEIDIDQYTALMSEIYLQQAEAWFNNSLLECGEVSNRGRVVCPTGVQDFPEGDMVSVAMQLALPVPQDASDKSYIYSAVFESDDDSGNDWVIQQPYDWDYFQGADRWYQLIWSHGSSQWSLTVTQVDGSQNTANVSSSSAVRAVINDDTIIFYIPRSELPGTAPAYRVSAFAHDGSYSQDSRGGDVSGADPTESLIPLP